MYFEDVEYIRTSETTERPTSFFPFFEITGISSLPTITHVHSPDHFADFLVAMEKFTDVILVVCLACPSWKRA